LASQKHVCHRLKNISIAYHLMSLKSLFCLGVLQLSVPVFTLSIEASGILERESDVKLLGEIIWSGLDVGCFYLEIFLKVDVIRLLQ